MDLGKVGKFIAELRKEKKLTQAQLGEKVGVTDKTVSKWEQGICAPNISILNELSKILGITTTELLNGKKFENISKKELADTTTKGMKYYINLSKKNLIKKMFVVILLTIILAISIIAFLFFKNNYDNCYVYELSSADPNYEVKGLITISPEKSIIIINRVRNMFDLDFLEEKVYAYECVILLDDKEIFKEGNIELYRESEKKKLIEFNEVLENINIYIIEKNILYRFEESGITLKIEYLNRKGKGTKDININLEKLYVNDKIMNES